MNDFQRLFSSQGRLVEIAIGTGITKVIEHELRRYFSDVSLASMADAFARCGECSDDNRSLGELRSSETMSPLVRARLANEMMRRPPSS